MPSPESRLTSRAPTFKPLTISLGDCSGDPDPPNFLLSVGEFYVDPLGKFGRWRADP